MVYLANEFPPTILEFSVLHGTVTRYFPLEKVLGSRKSKDGVEALTYLPHSDAQKLGYFLVGKQSTGEIFVFEIPNEQPPEIAGDPVEGSLKSIGSFIPQEMNDLSVRLSYELHSHNNLHNAQRKDTGFQADYFTPSLPAGT
jgi:hypothetical protein